MTRITSELLADIDRETINFIPNYDDTSHEPAVLPSKISQSAGQRLFWNCRGNVNQYPPLTTWAKSLTPSWL